MAAKKINTFVSSSSDNTDDPYNSMLPIISAVRKEATFTSNGLGFAFTKPEMKLPVIQDRIHLRLSTRKEWEIDKENDEAYKKWMESKLKHEKAPKKAPELRIDV